MSPTIKLAFIKFLRAYRSVENSPLVDQFAFQLYYDSVEKLHFLIESGVEPLKLKGGNIDCFVPERYANVAKCDSILMYLALLGWNHRDFAGIMTQHGCPLSEFFKNESSIYLELGSKLKHLEAKRFRELEAPETHKCSSCWKNFENGNLVLLLSYKHILHMECIARSMNKNLNCPSCRTEIWTLSAKKMK